MSIITTKAVPSLPSWEALAATIREAREARNARKTLERDLAGYRSRAELDELDAILARGAEEDVAPLRELVARQRARLAA